jgi:hypothetical protein
MVKDWSRALLFLLLLALLLPLFLPAPIPKVHAQSEPVPSIYAVDNCCLIIKNQGETFTVTFKASNNGGSPNDRGWSHVTISVSDGLEIVGWTRWSDRDRKYGIGELIWYRNERQIPAQNEMLEAYGSFPAGATRELTVTFRVKSPGWQWIKYRFTIVHFTQDEDWNTALYYRDPSSEAYTDQQGWPIYRIIVGQNRALVDVETSAGGRGWWNDNGGRFLIGMEIRIYCSVGVDVSRLRIAIGKVGSQEGVTLLDRGPSPAGRYQASYSIGEEGRYVILCIAIIDRHNLDWDATYIEVVRDTTPPTVRVIAPNGGERLTPGSVFRIRWEASDDFGVTKVRIWLVTTVSLQMIADNLPNTGYYDWTVPDSPRSDYRIQVIAWDGAGNSGSDISDGTFEIVGSTPPLPDLTVRDVRFSPHTVILGGSITVSWTEVNIGSENAGPYRVGVYLWAPEYGGSYLLGSLSRDGLVAGGSRSAMQTFMIPSSVPPGIYYVRVFIDSQGDVSESNEANNLDSSTDRVNVIQIQQFTVEIVSYSAPSTANTGQTVSVQLTIRYSFPSTSYVVVVISRQLSVNSWEDLWHNPDYQTQRSGQGTLTYTATFSVPNQPGTYRYLIRAAYWDGSQWVVADEKYFNIQVQQQQQLYVDVWTNKGGQGIGNLDGGQYTVGESITLYCETTAGATLLRMVLIRPDGSSVEVLKLSNVQAGTYSVSGTVGEPTGVWIASCIAQHGERDPVALLWDDVRFTVQQRATATVTVYTTTTRTVTSTLHATATTETTTYTTTTWTFYTTSTRTWYTVVTRTETETVTRWTTITIATVTTTEIKWVSFEGDNTRVITLSLVVLAPIAFARILRIRRGLRRSGGVARG